MPEKYLIDSYAWIEYLTGTEKGKKVKKIIDDEKNLNHTLDVCLAEIRFWTLREKTDFEKAYSIIRSTSTIFECWSNDWLKAAEIKFEKRKKHKDFGLVDALIMGKSSQSGCKIVTGDKHFKDEKNVVFLE